ncbi:hypothetical protein TIFTF001_030294 [Ficus carica]|uniref:Uncharacterized protein n=1 Tax=Ficus carica TaxID=3494 RepID=A0AA88IZE8_FICCA|nr:hypothetical protein TIFTF001_030294 [Ficus carica]
MPRKLLAVRSLHQPPRIDNASHPHFHASLGTSVSKSRDVLDLVWCISRNLACTCSFTQSLATTRPSSSARQLMLVTCLLGL